MSNSGSRPRATSGALGARQVLVERTVTPVEEDAYFASLAMANGTFKTTASGRLVDVDQWTLAHVDFPDQRPTVLDVGASTGTTTVDLVEIMKAHGLAPRVTATDLSLRASFVRIGGAEALRDSRGRFLEVRAGSLMKRRPYRLTGLRSLAGYVAAGVLASAIVGLNRIGAGTQQAVLLASSRAIGVPEIQLVEHDLFAPAGNWKGGFQLVRAANVLNRTYFSDAQLRVGVDRLIELVAPDGWLLVARSEAGPPVRNRASLWRRSPDGSVKSVARFNGGLDIDPLIGAP